MPKKCDKKRCIYPTEGVLGARSASLDTQLVLLVYGSNIGVGAPPLLRIQQRRALTLGALFFPMNYYAVSAGASQYQMQRMQLTVRLDQET